MVDELAATIARQYPGIRGYTRRNLFRMRQFAASYVVSVEPSARDAAALDGDERGPEPCGVTPQRTIASRSTAARDARSWVSTT